MRYLIALLLVSACDARLEDNEPATGGNPRRGQALITQFGCGSCHTIPGIEGATATVGPPLESFKKRVYIAGRLTNTPESLIQWIANPREVDPKTAMPVIGIDAAQARDIAAYLYAR